MSLEILEKESNEFVEIGESINIVNPQSMAEDGLCGKYLIVKGSKKLDCTRLDYLGYGSNEQIRNIMLECIKNNDLGCPASQMVMKSGATIKLEKALAQMHGMKESIIFVSGYPANENMMEALGLRTNTHHLSPYVKETGMGRLYRGVPTVFYMQEESHFSLEHGARIAKYMSKGRCIIRRFGSPNRLRELLEKERMESAEKIFRVIVTDSLSSATGKIFDIPEFCKIAEEYDCILYIDEAHAVGVLGPQGRGVSAEFSELDRYRNRIMIMGTLTKSFSHLGGYVTTDNTNMSWLLRFCSPQYIFSAPLPPWMSESLVRTLELSMGEYGDQERRKLNNLAAYARRELLSNGFDIMGSTTHIIPILIRDDLKADMAKELMEEKGFILSLFKSPAVPRGKSLIRISLCSDIEHDEVKDIIKCLIEVRKAVSF